MKLSIVGPEESKWSEEQKKLAIKSIYEIIKKYNNIDDNLIVISGHCPKGGVDIWTEDIADELNIKKLIFTPDINQWNSRLDDNRKRMLYGYKHRNTMIAKECDILYCIVPKIDVCENKHKDSSTCNPALKTDILSCYCKHCKVYGHPSNGGCWTLKLSRNLHKLSCLIII